MSWGVYIFIYLAILCNLVGMVKSPCKWLRDLQLGDQTVTFKDLYIDHIYDNMHTLQDSFTYNEYWDCPPLNERSNVESP